MSAKAAFLLFPVFCILGGQCLADTTGPAKCSMPKLRPVNSKYPNAEFLRQGVPFGMPMGLLKSPATEEFIEGVTAPLKSFYGSSNTFPPIRVTADPAYKAVSTLDRTEYIGFFVLTQAESDDEVAALIAHETAHIACGHMEDKANSDMISGLFNVAKYASLFVGGTGAILGSMEASFVGQYYVLSMANGGWSKKQEEQADLIAVDALAASGYDPTALISVVSKLPDIGDDPKTSHQKVTEAFAKKDNPNLTRDLINAYSESPYPKRAERISLILNYIREKYPNRHPTPRKLTFLNKWRSDARITITNLQILIDAAKTLHYPFAIWGHPESVGQRQAVNVARSKLAHLFELGSKNRSQASYDQNSASAEEMEGLQQTILAKWVLAEETARSGGSVQPSELESIWTDPDIPEWLLLGYSMGLLKSGLREQAGVVLDGMQDQFGEMKELLPLQFAANARPSNPEHLLYYSLGKDMGLTFRCRMGNDALYQQCLYASHNSDATINQAWDGLARLDAKRAN